MTRTFVLPLTLLSLIGCANRVTLQRGEDGEVWAETAEITARARCPEGCDDELREAIGHPEEPERALAALAGHDALITTPRCHRARGPWSITLPHPRYAEGETLLSATLSDGALAVVTPAAPGALQLAAVWAPSCAQAEALAAALAETNDGRPILSAGLWAVGLHNNGLLFELGAAPAGLVVTGRAP